MNTIKARFVGGPWHNQVKEVQRLNRIAVLDHIELGTKVSYYGVDHPPKITKSHFHYSYYHLQQAHSDQVIFFEYVHESVKGWPEEEGGVYELPRYMIFNFERSMDWIYLKWNHKY